MIWEAAVFVGSHTPLLKSLRLDAGASVAGKLFHCFIVLGKKLY